MAEVTDSTVLPVCQDGWVLHFLKELPVPVWILIFTVMFLGTWIIWQPDFVPRLIDGLVGALLLSLRLAPAKPSNMNIQTDTLNADSVDKATTQTGDINANNVQTVAKDKDISQE